MYALRSVPPPPWLLPTQTSAGGRPGPEVDSRGGDWISLSITEVTSVLARSERSGDTCSWGRATGGSSTCRVDMGTGVSRPALHLSAASFLSDPLALSSACSAFPDPSRHPHSLSAAAPPLPLPARKGVLAKDFCPFSLDVSSSGRSQVGLWAWRFPAQVALSAGPGGARVFWGAVMPWPAEQLGQRGEGESSSRRN